MQVGPAKRMPLTLLRHGESNWNALHLVQGQNDEARLSARGVEQARVVAGEWDRHSFDAIVSSNLVRAFETSQIIADALGIEVTTNALLRERSFGDFEGSPLSELPSSLSGFADGHVIDDGARPPGGESLRDLWRRGADLVEQLRSERPNERLLLVTHGGTIRAIRAYCASKTMRDLTWDRVRNCSVWMVEAPDVPPDHA
ncbi:MAG: histidine phosphatase family protein [Acidimicrobiales bacterium]